MMSTIQTPLDNQFALLLNRWCLHHDDRKPSGAIVIPFYENGFAIQYLGTEDLDADQLLGRLAWVASQVLLADPKFSPQ
jgi:hypothetical protein